MDTKKLRQKILDLAIHGKLVPQDLNDEPASVLLERIKAEKEQLIKEGKIKRQKKSVSSDTSHYGNIPTGWVWTTIGELLINRDGERKPVSLDIRNKQQDKKYNYYGAAGVIDLVDSYLFDDKLLLIGEDGANLLSRSKNNAIIAEGRFWVNNHAHVLDSTNKAILDYVAFVINTMALDDYITGSAQPKLSQDNLNKIPIALPPLNEQQRIIAMIETWHSQIDIIDAEKSSLNVTIQNAKFKILDLALSGKLTSDTSHYPQLPDGWEYKQLDEVLDYEQPQKYIVESTDYSDDYTMPVLTAGKSFIIGHTNERTGICTDVPVIIFDDFTTDSKFVNFPFKVKSSAMKILHPKVNINLKYIAYFMSTTRLVGTTHKRYWISEYSKIKVPVPPKEEQDKIVFLIEKFYSLMDNIFVDQS